jgi:hypothetical protein
MNTARRTTLATLLATLLMLAVTPLVSQATGAARSLQDDLGVWNAAPSAQPALLDEIAYKLRSKQLRMYVFWDAAEPTKDVYNDAYLSTLKDTVALARARGISIIATVYHTPKWASNSAYWNSPPAGLAKGYQNFYVMKRANLPDFQAFARHVATYFGTDVAAYECWNEPNLWNFMYPQRTTTDSIFAVRLYRDMLKRFHDGIKLGNPSALVVAGATGPYGANDKWRTSPQRWASKIRAFKVGRYFDVYSHHPYPVGPTTITAPEAKPRDATHTVSLGNISVLLKKFPRKPFYLTEYGYNTAYSLVFGGFKVSKIQQADYLRRAFIYVRRYPRIKYLTWLYVRDFSPTGKSSNPLGVYTGLKTLRGAKKRAYYSFARGNSCSLVTPAKVHRGVSFKVSGYLKSKYSGPIVGVGLKIQRRLPGSTTWRTIYTTKTSTGGFYRAGVRQWTSAAYYRAKFSGVVWSSAHRVVAN